MISKLRQLILKLNAMSEQRQSVQLGRKAVAMAGVLARAPEKAGERLEGIALVARQHEEETSTWVAADALLAGQGGPFDACDLRHWLALAERAGVPYVPAREIIAIPEEEASFLSGPAILPEGRQVDRIRERLSKIPEVMAAKDDPEPEGSFDREDQAAVADLMERLSSAMDDVPEGWMVRSARCGGSELKSLAGFGAGGPTVPETRFGPDLEVGPGWVRHGNRRQVNASDSRTVEMYAQGPSGPLVFLARPWVEAARYAVGEDPHRHGTQFAGKGIWPAEWRAFVEDNVVVGVASYYGWCGSVTPENARIAIEVRELAQRVVDAAIEQAAHPRFMDIEFLRLNQHPTMLANEKVQQALSLFARDKVACTLDFIETPGGILLLEGGPPNTPFGGGHPCAFAGCGGQPRAGNKTDVHGVAFRIMDGVILADPRTWNETSREDCVLTWDQVHALAETPQASP